MSKLTERDLDAHNLDFGRGPSPASWRAADFCIALIVVVVVGMVFA